MPTILLNNSLILWSFVNSVLLKCVKASHAVSFRMKKTQARRNLFYATGCTEQLFWLRLTTDLTLSSLLVYVNLGITARTSKLLDENALKNIHIFYLLFYSC